MQKLDNPGFLTLKNGNKVILKDFKEDINLLIVDKNDNNLWDFKEINSLDGVVKIELDDEEYLYIYTFYSMFYKINANTFEVVSKKQIGK